MTDFKPSCRYPAALAYQLAIGVIMRVSHGLLRMKLANDGCDIVHCSGHGRQWHSRSVGRSISDLDLVRSRRSDEAVT